MLRKDGEQLWSVFGAVRQIEVGVGAGLFAEKSVDPPPAGDHAGSLRSASASSMSSTSSAFMEASSGLVRAYRYTSLGSSLVFGCTMYRRKRPSRTRPDFSSTLADAALSTSHTAETRATGISCSAIWVSVDSGAGPERLWREERIQEVLWADDAEVLFISGTSRNQAKFYPQFDYIVLLSTPAQVLIERLTSRTNNRYGKNPNEQAETLQFLETVEPLLRRRAP